MNGWEKKRMTAEETKQEEKKMKNERTIKINPPRQHPKIDFVSSCSDLILIAGVWRELAEPFALACSVLDRSLIASRDSLSRCYRVLCLGSNCAAWLAHQEHGS